MTEKVHGLFGLTKNRTNVISVEILEKVTTFINNYAEHHGIPLPGRLPNFKDFRITKLPSSTTKAFLYRLYIEANQNERTVGRSSFYDIWQRMCPFITTMKPASDLCDICQEQSTLFGKTKFRNADDIEQKLNEFKEHIKYSKMQREYYKECCKNSATMESTLVLSFDYAQTVNYPSCPQQRGSSYFKAARKCSIFGIHNEATRVQFNYLIDEEFDVGKGPNSVISMLDNYLAKQPSAKNLILFADNCIGQNKNNTVVNYLAHRVRMNLNEKIEYNFLLSGHTKFSPDRSFGLLKMCFSRSTVDCFDDFVQAVINSSPGGLNQVVNGAEVTFKKYDSYFAQFNKPFKGITRNHHFTFEKTGNKCKEFFDSDEMEFDLKIGPIPESDPEVISPIGLSLERKWYLFKQIRDLCTDPMKRDLVAPEPKERLQKEKNNKSEEAARNVKKGGNEKKSNKEVEKEKPNAKKLANIRSESRPKKRKIDSTTASSKKKNK